MANSLLKEALAHALEKMEAWEASFRPFPAHPAGAVEAEALYAALDRYTDRLRGNYPFFHPDYAGQMLKPPHPAAVAGYVAAMLVNPNNHALDGGPPTSEMEKEVVQKLAAMFALPADALGHLTSSGTIANLEALWVARQLHPEKGIAASEAAHYTHSRMAQVLGVPFHAAAADARGALDLDALEALLRQGNVGTVVATAGTTGQGTVDPISDLVPLARRYGARVHVDAAYGGFFSLLAHAHSPDLREDVAAHFRAIGGCDSVVVDPHKHGLQPYGCGCVLFRDPSVGRFYVHDSPYTYFTSSELHLGEISLECSRAGAAAGALWLTLEVLPLEAARGLGPMLAAGLRACRRFTAAAERAAPFVALNALPDLDIAVYAPRAATASQVDALSARLFAGAMQLDEPIFVSLFRTDTTRLAAALPGVVADQPHARVLRSVLMKPEHELEAEGLVSRLAALAAA